MGIVQTGRGSGGYRRVVAAASIGTLIEAYDSLIYGYFAIVLAAQFFPQEDPTAGLLATFAIFAVGFIIRPMGSIIFGHIGDRLGRRTALASSLLIMTFATMGFGLLPTYDSVGVLAPVLLLLCRLLQGLSLSAEVPGAPLLILEHISPDWRGRAVAFNTAGFCVGGVAAAATGLALAQLLSPAQLAEWGWRAAFLAAAPIGLVGLYIRFRVLETPAFVALGEGARQGGAPLGRALRTAKRNMFVLLMWMAAATLTGYLVFGFMPSYLIRVTRLPQIDVFAVNLIAMITAGLFSFVAGYLVDRWGPRVVATAVMVGTAATAMPGFWLITEDRTFLAAVITQTVWSMFLATNLIVSAVLGVILFAVPIRFTAIALISGLTTTLSGSTAPYVATWLVVNTHSPLAPGVYLVVAAVCGVLASIFGLPRHSVAPAESIEGHVPDTGGP
jgi:MHS family proline/betaine transporter-like MFS transporter